MGEFAVGNPFVWFDVRTKDAARSRSFYQQLFGWDIAEVLAGTATLTMVGGGKPWATVVPDRGEHPGWLPYVQVDDLNSATKKAKELGATVLEAPVEGPAGTYTPIQEPGGAVFALFQPRA
jgi:predicted enzyme related to lactoylglutathione lyase